MSLTDEQRERWEGKVELHQRAGRDTRLLQSIRDDYAVICAVDAHLKDLESRVAELTRNRAATEEALAAVTGLYEAKERECERLRAAMKEARRDLVHSYTTIGTWRTTEIHVKGCAACIIDAALAADPRAAGGTH